MADVDEIVVTGRRTADTYSDKWFYRDWMSSGFDNYFTSQPSDGAGQGGAAAISDVVQTPVADYKIPATEDMPEIILTGVTQKQYDEFMSFYSNMKYDPELKTEFMKLASNNNVIKLTMSETLPPRADPDALATITFRKVGDEKGQNEIVMPNTTIEIVVKGSSLNENGTWDVTFKGILAHEFTHLKKDEHGSYLKDHYNENYDGLTTRSKDKETYDNLKSVNSGENYSSSLEISMTFDPMYNITTFNGTEGNNHIDMSRATSDHTSILAYTGSGNDLIIGSDFAFQTVVVNGSGRKAFAFSDNTYDSITLSNLETISKLIVSYIGSDAYLTSSDSTFAPIDDPNAVVILGMTQGSRTKALDFVNAADFSYIELHPFSYNSTTAEAYAQSSQQPWHMLQEDQMLSWQRGSSDWDYM